MVVTLVVLEGLKCILMAEMFSVLEEFSIMANIGKKIRRIFVALEGLVAEEFARTSA